MNHSLRQLQALLATASASRCEAPQPFGMSIYRCHQPQQLSSIPFNSPTLLLVVKGAKTARMESREFTLAAGEMLLLPPDLTLQLGSYPDQHSELYLGVAVRFSSEAVSHFRGAYGNLLTPHQSSPSWHVQADELVLQAIGQWASLRPQIAGSPSLNQHRQVELLLLLAEQGLVGNLLADASQSWSKRVSLVLASDPSHPWQLQQLCERLNVSESSLRRKLQAEQSGFRELLDEIRLGKGLSLLLESSLSIGQVADAAGYQSQSRFGERIKARFGLTPSEIRSTVSAKGEDLAV